MNEEGRERLTEYLGEKSNRGFTTWDDLGACKGALVRDGLWQKFINYTTMISGLSHRGNYINWLFRPVNEMGGAHFCTLVVEFLEAKDGK